MPARVLIVEDDDRLSRMCGKVLTHTGFRVRHASTVSTATEWLWKFDPDIVYLDWMIGQETGADFLNYVQQQNPESIPCVLLVSGAVRQGEIQPWGDLIRDVLLKPLTIHHLVTVVTALEKEAVNRQPLGEILVESLASHLFRITCRGNIRPRTLEALNWQPLADAGQLVFDLREMALDAFQVNPGWLTCLPAMPYLEGVHILHLAEERFQAEAVMSFFREAVPVNYYEDAALLEAALAQVALVHGARG